MPEQDTDELYKVPLAEFVRARDTISARRRAAGDKDGAAEVKRVRRPTLPAWAANQVVWHAPAEWQRLRAAAGALRRGHAIGASADELRRASREQREALQACESRAAGFLVASGHGAVPAVVQKASGTLQALAYGVAGAEPGRVQEELPPPGFEVLAGMGLGAPERRPEASTSAPSPAEPARASVSSLAEAARHRAERHAQERASVREEQQAREEERARRRAAVGAAEERLARANRALGQARTEVLALERKLQELEQAAETARRAADKARRALAAAEAEAAAADAALEALRGGGAEG